MSGYSIVLQIAFYASLCYLDYLLYPNFRSKYKSLERIKKDDEFVIVEAVGMFSEIIYTKVTCVENDVKNKVMLLRGKTANGSLFAKAYKYDCWNFKDFDLMQKVFDKIQDEFKNQEAETEQSESDKNLSLTDSLLQSEELLAQAQMFEDAAKVRDIKNKILQNA